VEDKLANEAVRRDVVRIEFVGDKTQDCGAGARCSLVKTTDCLSGLSCLGSTRGRCETSSGLCRRVWTIPTQSVRRKACKGETRRDEERRIMLYDDDDAGATRKNKKSDAK
jgi:hypothetical protein